MISLLHRTDADVIGLQLTGPLSPEDKASLAPLLREQSADGGRVRAVLDVTTLQRPAPADALRSIRESVLEDVPLARCAIIGDQRWHAAVEREQRLARDARVRCFHPYEVEDAWRYAHGTAPPRSPESKAGEPPPPRELREARSDSLADQRLEDIAYDEQQLLVADEEGMVGGRTPRLDRIRRVQRALRRDGMVLIATDFSETSRRAYRPAVEIARRLGAPVRLLHVKSPAAPTTPPDAMAFPPSPIEPPVDDAALEGRLAEEVASLGVPRADHALVSALQRESAIAEYAAGHRVALVAMGTHARGGALRLLLGSTTEATQRRATTPVLAVPPDSPEHLPKTPLIVAAMATPDAANPALGPALDLAQRLQGALSMIHVIPAPVPTAGAGGLGIPSAAVSTPRLDETLADASEAMRRIHDELAATGALDAARIRQAVVTGSSIEEALLRRAQQDGADLVVLASRKLRGPRRWLMGSTTEAFLRGAKTPVLIHPADDEAAADDDDGPRADVT